MLSVTTLPAAPKGASGIYRIHNTQTGKSYVGSAIDLNVRFYNHVWHLERGTHRGPKMLAAWQKHGPDAFVIEVIEIVEQAEMLIEREQVWIDHFNSAVDGYNTNPLAKSNFGRTFDETQRRKVSEAARKAMSDPVVKARHRKATKEAMKDPERRRKISEAVKRAWADPERRKRIMEKRNDPEYKAAHHKRVVKGVTEWMSKLTKAEKARRSHRIRWKAIMYRVVTPTGNILYIPLLSDYCRDHKIPFSQARRVLEGTRDSACGFVFSRVRK